MIAKNSNREGQRNMRKKTTEWDLARKKKENTT